MVEQETAQRCRQILHEVSVLQDVHHKMLSTQGHHQGFQLLVEGMDLSFLSTTSDSEISCARFEWDGH